MSADEEARLAGLMRSAIAGDEAAYADFLRHASRFVRALARRKLGSDSRIEPEDIVQEVLLAIHLKRHTWRTDEPILPWLAAIARYKVVDGFRRRGRRMEVDIEDYVDLLEAPVADMLGERDIGRAIDSLAPGQHKVVTSVAIDGRSIRETATAFGMTENAVRVAWHRGLSAIAVKFGRTGK